MSCVVHMYYRLPYTVNLLNIKLLHVKNTLTYLDMLQESTGSWVLVSGMYKKAVTSNCTLSVVLRSTFGVYVCATHYTHTRVPVLFCFCF